MKILRVIASINPADGGTVSTVLESSLQLIKNGHAVELVTSDNRSDQWVVNSSLSIFALGVSKSVYGYSPKMKKWLDQSVKNYDVVIIEGIWQYHTIAAARASKAAAVPYFIFPHGMLAPWFKKTYPIKHLKKLFYWLFLLRKIMIEAKGVIFTVDEERQAAKSSFPFYQCRELVVTLGIKDLVVSEKSKKIIFLKYPEIKDKAILLFVGRIHPKKGIDILIEAFAKEYKDDVNTILLIVGPEEVEGLRRELENLAKKLHVDKKIIFTGQLIGEEKWSAYAAASCFTLPSHQENFGMVIAEALSLSLPVLISNQINIFSEIEACNAGLISNDNVEDYSAVIKIWRNMSTIQKEQMSKNARQCFVDNFEISAAVKHLEKVLF